MKTRGLPRRTKRHFLLESLEDRACPSGMPTMLPAVSLPTYGPWTGDVGNGSPVFADLANNGNQEVITPTAGDPLNPSAKAPGVELVAYSISGGNAGYFQSYKTWGNTTANVYVPPAVDGIWSTPIVVTDPATGRKDIFAAVGTNFQSPTGQDSENGTVYGWDAQSGQILAGWPVDAGHGKIPGPIGMTPNGGVLGPLASGDLLGNGGVEIVATSLGSTITAFNLNGSTLWQTTDNDTVISGAVVGDLNHTGKDEVIVGGDSSYIDGSASNNPANSPYLYNNTPLDNGGWVNILNGATGTVEYRHELKGETVWSSPVLADLTGNGNLEIIVGTGVNFVDYGGFSSYEPGLNESSYLAAGNQILALDYQGNVLPGWPYNTTSATSPTNLHETPASPAVADLFGNGQQEVVELDESGYLHVVMSNGQDLPGFQGGIALPDNYQLTQYRAAGISGPPPAGTSYGIASTEWTTPVIADVTGSGHPEIVVASGDVLLAYDTSGHMLWRFDTQFGNPLSKGTGPAEFLGVSPAISRGNDAAPGTLQTYNLAITTTLSGAGNGQPEFLDVFTTPPTSQVPLWNEQRKTPEGRAVSTLANPDYSFVVTATKAALNRFPGAGDADYTYLMLNNLIDWKGVAASIETSLESRDDAVTKAFQEVFGVAPNQANLTAWANFLTQINPATGQTNSIRDMIVDFAGGGYFPSYGSTQTQAIDSLYQGLLGRQPNSTELNQALALPATSQGYGTLAQQLVRGAEYNQDQLNIFIAWAGWSGVPFSADSGPAVLYDAANDIPEETIFSYFLASFGNYAATTGGTSEGAFVESIYHDILRRAAGPTEVAGWLNQFLANYYGGVGNLNNSSFINTVQASPEAHNAYILDRFDAYFHRAPSASELSYFQGYTSHESLLINILDATGPTSYFTINGGADGSTLADDMAYTAAVYRDFQLFSAYNGGTQYFQNYWAPLLFNHQVSLASFANTVIFSPQGIRERVINDFFQYEPTTDESVPIIVDPDTKTASGAYLYPNAGPLLTYYLNGANSGWTDAQVVAAMVFSPQYYQRATYYSGIYHARAIRY